ncbi:hypothetical protein ACFQPA_07565 [Halomarina halobia]|uniref:DUF1206 domain-containing protein n=1 Tax=Halomarina halobia TaxID=3033386 RepID=A0ABD6ACH3_9EURY|nr:hypothetical protein [Halomarina sp. PSR21]
MAPPLRSHAVVSPEPGTAWLAVWFSLLYAVVDRAAGAVGGAIRSFAPGFDAAQLSTALAGLLWVAFLTVVGVGVVRQYRANPRAFGDRDVLRAFLDAHRPERERHALALAAALVGGAVVAVARDPFFAALDGTSRGLVALVETGTLAPFSWTSLVGGVVFLGGFALFAYGVDRAMTGAHRELLFQYHSRR